MAEVFFWSSVLALLHTYFFYPLLLWAMDGLRLGRRSPRRDDATSPSPLPSVSLVVAAHNEIACIAQKLSNSLALDYPQDRFELLIGSDGSDDGTDGVVQACADPRVRLSAAPRGGKTSVLNRCIPDARGEIVVLSDANTQIDPAAVRMLVRHFEDPEVGVVCGKLKLFNPTKKDYEESAYWAYESRIKLYEGRQGTVMGANGGLYAIRRTLFTHLPPSTIVDDFVIPLRILEQGFRVVYEPEAIATEETTESYDAEFGRRARIAAGNFQSLTLVPGLLTPRAGFAAFAFWSHKLLRWIAPALMAVAFVTNVALLGDPSYDALFAAQVLFYALALAGKAGLPGPLRRVASIAYYFVSMNVAMAVGFWRFVRNAQGAAWDRTARA